MSKKYQVFISSTFTDLVQERQEAIRTVLDLGHIPSGMEIFPAADIEQFRYIKKVIDECDYYVLIIGARYGSMDAAGVSFTEKEYDYAVEQKKTVLAFIHGDPGSIAVAKADTDPALAAKLTAFREKVSTGRLVQYWKTTEELKYRVTVALAKAFGECRELDGFEVTPRRQKTYSHKLTSFEILSMNFEPKMRNSSSKPCRRSTDLQD